MDEAVSNLHDENEALLHRATANAAADRTTLIIAHRLSGPRPHRRHRAGSPRPAAMRTCSPRGVYAGLLAGQHIESAQLPRLQPHRPPVENARTGS